MDLMLIYMREIREEARKHHVSVTDTVNRYLEAYHEHKSIHGSYRDIGHESHYMQKMHERYRFMREKALEFVTQQVEEHRKGLGRDSR